MSLSNDQSVEDQRFHRPIETCRMIASCPRLEEHHLACLRQISAKVAHDFRFRIGHRIPCCRMSVDCYESSPASLAAYSDQACHSRA